VHIIQLLDPLLPAPHAEIIKPPLPETPWRFRWRLGPQSHLVLIRPRSRLPSHSTRHPLFQNLNHRRRRVYSGLRNQQMNVRRHHHVPNQPELISLPHLIQNPQERITPPPRSQQRPTPVTTARNKVQLPLPIPPLQFITHRLRHSRALSPAKSRQSRVRHPELQKQRQTQNQSTSKSTTAVVSSAAAMRHSHPQAARIIASSERVGHPPGVRELWDPVYISAVAAAAARTWSVTIRGYGARDHALICFCRDVRKR